jgi:hypothetical protein
MRKIQPRWLVVLAFVSIVLVGSFSGGFERLSLDWKALVSLNSANLFKADDKLPNGPLDMSRPAFLNWNLGFGQTGEAQVTCDAYCLRLLYSGKAKSVISGHVSESGFANDQVKVLPKDPAGRFACATQNPRQAGPKCELWVREYRLERKLLCPRERVDYTRGFRSKRELTREQAGERFVPDAVSVYSLAAAGLCLIWEDVDIGKASTVIFPNYSVTVDGQPAYSNEAETMRYYVDRGLAFNFDHTAQPIELYRRTRTTVNVSQGSLIPRPDSYQSRKSDDDREPGEILAHDLKLSFPSLPTQTREQVRAGFLAELQASLVSDRNWLFQSELSHAYFEGLRVRKTLDDQDIAVLNSIIDRKDLGTLHSALSSLLDDLDDTKGAMVPNLLKAIGTNNTLKYDAKGYNTSGLYELLAAMPIQSRLANENEIVKLATELPKSAPFWIVSVVSGLNFEKIQPLLADQLNITTHSFDGQTTMIYLCGLGPTALPLKNEMIARYRRIPQDDLLDNRVYLSTFIKLNIDEEALQNVALGQEQRRIYRLLKANPSRAVCQW